MARNSIYITIWSGSLSSFLSFFYEGKPTFVLQYRDLKLRYFCIPIKNHIDLGPDHGLPRKHHGVIRAPQ